jgi:glycosyltransferase involved in cell wall biosynthesis
MNLYAREVVRGWSESYPDDKIFVVGDSWVSDAFADLENVAVTVLRSRNVLARFLAQIVGVAFVFWRRRGDYLLSLSSVVSPVIAPSKTSVVIHDWRHKVRPEEFGRGQRLYRRLWEYCISHASLTIAISDKTARETRRWARPRAMVVIANGGDHPRRWRKRDATPAGPASITTFGHFRNKRPELAVSALALIRETGQDARLTILGANGAHRDELRRLSEDLGVSESVDTPGFVDEFAYEQVIQSSAVLSLLSSDEGYGLPVVEARYFGVPVVVTTDGGLSEIHGDAVIAVEPEPAAIGAEIIRLLSRVGPGAEGERSVRSWADCVSEIRAAICAAAGTRG